MSNFLAIATVTAALRKTLEAALGADVSGATVTTVRPERSGSSVSTKGAYLYLYQVTPNASLVNIDMPNYSSEGRLVQRPQVALDLHYLLTFYGDDIELEPQRLLGSAVRTLHSRPILIRQTIIDAINDPQYHSFLENSNLVDAIETVKFTPVSLSLDELYKLWSVFFQTPYELSVAYIATVVLIESDDVLPSTLPVREPEIFAVPVHQPIIEKVLSAEGDGKPIVAESTLIIRGKKLRGDTTKVKVNGTEVKLESISETEITIKLPTGLLSGVHGLQVVHEIQICKPQPPIIDDLQVVHEQMCPPQMPPKSVGSNLAAFVLHPTIPTIEGNNAIMVINLQETGVDLRSADLKIKIRPKVEKEQNVVLILNEISNVKPASYTFVGKPSEIDPETIEIRVSGVNAAEYFVRVQVDGAQSQLITDTDRQSQTFNQYIGPMVKIL